MNHESLQGLDIKELFEENERLRVEVEKWRIAEGEAGLVIESQDLQIERLRKALEFYADPDLWHGEEQGDYGRVARVALEGAPR